MPLFRTNPFPRSAPRLTDTHATPHFATVSKTYRRLIHRHPFAAFGLPFMLTIVSGSFFLTPATAVRYERFDRKTHMLDREEALGLDKRRQEGKKKGGFKERDIREEYWKLAGQADRLDSWEPVRVKRLPGEMDGTFD